MTDDRVIEEAAKAMADVSPDATWEDLTETERDWYVRDARAAFEVFEKAHGGASWMDRAIYAEAMLAEFEGVKGAAKLPENPAPTVAEGTTDERELAAWQAIADALGGLGYELNSAEETRKWVEDYLLRRTVPEETGERLIEDTDALAALPPGSVVMAVNEWRLSRPKVFYRVGPNGWTCDGYRGYAGPIPLPVRVLWLPVEREETGQ